MTGFDTGDGDVASHHSRACDGGDHWSYLTIDVVRPALNSNSSVDSKTYCLNAAATTAFVVEFVR